MMDKSLIDLHTHTFFSDGTMSPEELVEIAVQNNVKVLSVTDHNTIKGSLLAGKLAKDRGIRFISGAEIDTIDGNVNVHLLAYGFEINDDSFLDFLHHTRFMLDELSVKLIECMAADYPLLSMEEFMDYQYDKRLGGWKGLHYLLEKGVTASLKAGIPFYPQYGCFPDKAGYATVAAGVHRIRKAGGYAILAHPAETFDTTDVNRFKADVRRMIAFGIDGIECYYPSNSAAVTQACLELCREYDLLITAGSDFHGTYGKYRIGEMGITADRLKLPLIDFVNE